MIEKIIKFLVLGVGLFFLDFSILYVLTDIIGVNYLVSSLISFSISNIVNYYLSKIWVFKSNKSRFILFVVLSVIGLGLTQSIMFLMVDILKIHYLFAKIVSTGIVMVFNFITRYAIL